MSSGVLVVDDDPAFRGLACRLLIAGGLAVVGEAGGVATAIAAATALRPCAALVDVGLPDGDGIDLARELSAHPWNLRVILTSSDPDAATAEDIRRSGADAFFPKDQLARAPLSSMLTIP